MVVYRIWSCRIRPLGAVLISSQQDSNENLYFLFEAPVSENIIGKPYANELSEVLFSTAASSGAFLLG